MRHQAQVEEESHSSTGGEIPHCDGTDLVGMGLPHYAGRYVETHDGRFPHSGMELAKEAS